MKVNTKKQLNYHTNWPNTFNAKIYFSVSCNIFQVSFYIVLKFYFIKSTNLIFFSLDKFVILKWADGLIWVREDVDVVLYTNKVCLSLHATSPKYNDGYVMST